MSNWRNSRDYRQWRIAVIRRDGRCVICNSLNHRHAHHLNHATYFHNQRFDSSNGVTLCAKCHSHYHNDYHNSYREKCTAKDFSNFKSLVEYLKGVFDV